MKYLSQNQLYRSFVKQHAEVVADSPERRNVFRVLVFNGLQGCERSVCVKRVAVQLSKLRIRLRIIPIHASPRLLQLAMTPVVTSSECQMSYDCRIVQNEARIQFPNLIQTRRVFIAIAELGYFATLTNGPCGESHGSAQFPKKSPQEHESYTR